MGMMPPQGLGLQQPGFPGVPMPQGQGGPTTSDPFSFSPGALGFGAPAPNTFAQPSDMMSMGTLLDMAASPGVGPTPAGSSPPMAGQPGPAKVNSPVVPQVADPFAFPARLPSRPAWTQEVPPQEL